MSALRVKKLRDGAHEPSRANPGDLGYDLYAAESVVIPKGGAVPVPTGLSLQFPEGWGGIIKDRSSMALKRLTTSAGVIDNGYRGEVAVILNNHSDRDVTIEPGAKIAQIVPVKVTDWDIIVVDEVNGTERGANGFGSSGHGKGGAAVRAAGR